MPDSQLFTGVKSTGAVSVAASACFDRSSGVRSHVILALSRVSGAFMT